MVLELILFLNFENISAKIKLFAKTMCSLLNQGAELGSIYEIINAKILVTLPL